MQQITVENDASLKAETEHGAQCSSDQGTQKLPQKHATHYKHPDVDSGWAFIVLGASFGSFFICIGLMSTTGIYYVQMLEHFGKDRSYTSWMGSLMNAFFLLAGPLSSCYMHRWGTRTAVRTGSIAMTSGLFVSAFTPSLEILFFTYGIVAACGINFVYTGQISALNLYFDKYQSIATSLAMMGIGTGMFVVNIWTDYIIKKYGWRGSFIWNAGLSLQIIVLGSLIYTVHWPQLTNINSGPSVSSIYNTLIFLSTGATSLSAAKLRESTWHVLKDICFWLISIAFFFAMLSTTTIFIVYKDFMKSRDFAEQYTNVLIGLGVADSIGRLSMGIVHTNKFFNPVWSYCVSLFLTGVVVMCHVFIKTLTSMYILGTLYGLTYGAQNVLVVMAPIRLFGKNRLVMVFCYLFFFGGIGALIGAPIAGAMVDKTGGYEWVLGLTLACLTVAAVLIMLCALIDAKKVHTDEQ